MSQHFNPGRLRRTALAASLVALSAAASAGVLIQQRDFDLHGSAIPFYGDGMAIGDKTGALYYDKWDPALGTLTAARWKLSSWMDAEALGRLRSTSTDPNETVIAEVDLRAVAGTNGLVGTIGAHVTLDQEYGLACYTSLAIGQCDIPLHISEAVDGVVEATQLAALVGLGQFQQTVFGYMEVKNSMLTANAEILSYGWFDYDGAPGSSFGGTLELVYEYETTGGSVPGNSVPEPSSALLVALGLFAAAGARFGRPVR